MVTDSSKHESWLLGLWEDGKRLPELDLAFKFLDICGQTFEHVFAQTSCDAQTPSGTPNGADKFDTTSSCGTSAVWVFALSGDTWVGGHYRGSASSDMNVFSVSSLNKAKAISADDIEGVRYFAQLTESLPTLVRLGTGEILLQTDADNVSVAYKKFLSGGNAKKKSGLSKLNLLQSNSYTYRFGFIEPDGTYNSRLYDCLSLLSVVDKLESEGKVITAVQRVE